MAFPTEGWPPRVPSGRRSIRFYQASTATGNFSDNAYLFVDGLGANPFNPLPVVLPGSSAPVAIGDTATPGSPMGSGRAAVDANRSLPDVSGAQGQPKAAIWSQAIRVVNTSAADLEFSFDGTNVHGKVGAGKEVIYRERYEAGICVRGNGTFWVEAW